MRKEVYDRCLEESFVFCCIILYLYLYLLRGCSLNGNGKWHECWNDTDSID